MAHLTAYKQVYGQPAHNGKFYERWQIEEMFDFEPGERQFANTMTEYGITIYRLLGNQVRDPSEYIRGTAIASDLEGRLPALFSRHPRKGGIVVVTRKHFEHTTGSGSQEIMKEMITVEESSAPVG